MPDILGLLSKFFSNEPLERLMFMVLIFALTLIFMPESVQVLINDKIGIPYSYQLVAFATSFVFAINAQRAFFFVKAIMRKRNEEKKKRELYEHVNQIIDSFNKEQYEIMRTALSRHYPVINAYRDNKDIMALVRSGVLVSENAQMLPHEAPLAMLHVRDIFWKVMMSRWNGYTGTIERRPHS